VKNKFIIALVTCANKKEALSIKERLLKKKTVACVNLLENVSSFYWWMGKIDSGKEVLLLIKSERKLLNLIIKIVKQNHSYKVPEIIALPIIGGSSDYLKWISDSVA
jgi:periplasmic divalent cation tolerance protein